MVQLPRHLYIAILIVLLCSWVVMLITYIGLLSWMVLNEKEATGTAFMEMKVYITANTATIIGLIFNPQQDQGQSKNVLQEESHEE